MVMLAAVRPIPTNTIPSGITSLVTTSHSSHQSIIVKNKQLFYPTGNLKTIRIVDVKGRNMLTRECQSGVNTINLASFSPGAYFVVGENKNGKVIMSNKIMVN